MTPKTLQQIYRLTSEGSFPAFLEIYHPEIDGGVWRLVNYRTDLVYNGNTYSAAIFTFTPPKYSDKQINNATISISAIDQSVIELIRKLSSRASAKIVAGFYFEGGDLTIDPIEEWEFKLSSVNWTEISATWELLYDDRLDIQVPTDKMSAQKCPGVA